MKEKWNFPAFSIGCQSFCLLTVLGDLLKNFFNWFKSSIEFGVFNMPREFCFKHKTKKFAWTLFSRFWKLEDKVPKWLKKWKHSRHKCVSVLNFASGPAWVYSVFSRKVKITYNYCQYKLRINIKIKITAAVCMHMLVGAAQGAQGRSFAEAAFSAKVRQ
jgi:hypothetical protein